MSAEPKPVTTVEPAAAGALPPANAEKPPPAVPGAPAAVTPAATPSPDGASSTSPTIEDMLGQPGPTEPTDVGNLNPYQAIQFSDDKGELVTTTLGQLVDRFKKPDALEPSDAQLLGAVKGAMAGDANAIQQLVALQTQVETPGAPAASAAPGGDGDRVVQLQQQVDTLNQQVAQQTPLLGQIEMARKLSLVRNMAAQCTDTLPFVNKHPEGPQMVLGTIQQLEQVAQMQNINPQAPDVRRQLVVQAFNAVEGQLRNTYQSFTGWEPPKPGEAPAAGPAITVVDDQVKPGPRTIPAGLRLIEGQLVNQLGQAVDRTGQPLPSQPPAMAPIGGSPSAEPPKPAGPMTPARMVEGMAARARELEATL